MTQKKNKKKGVFLDRDGVINEMVYNPEFGTIDSPLNPEEFKLLKGVVRAIKSFNKLGFLVIVISNQPAIAKGKMSLTLLEKINKKMKKALKKEGGQLDNIYYCLHHPNKSQVKIKKYLKNCNCRKPKSGLLLKATKDHNIDLKKSFMVGDGLIDIKAGKKAGCKTIFIGNLKSYYLEAMQKEKIKPDFVASSLLKAVDFIKK